MGHASEHINKHAVYLHISRHKRKAKQPLSANAPFKYIAKVDRKSDEMSGSGVSFYQHPSNAPAGAVTDLVVSELL